MSNPKNNNIFLSRRQLEYVIKMVEISDPNEAVEKFALIMLEEKADPGKMEMYINRLMEKSAAK